MQTFSFPSNNIGRLDAGLARINKRADKLGMPHITYVETGREIKKVASGDPDRPWVNIEYVTIALEGEVPQIDGWKMLASLEYDEGVTIVNLFPSVESIDPMYREREPFCDHCNTRKVKKYSVIIQNIETGETKQVGKTCLKDFFDKDISMYITYWGWVDRLVDDLTDEDGEYFGFGSGVYRYDLTQFLEVAFCAVRQWGYVKSGEMGATRDAVANYFFTKNSKDREAYVFEKVDGEKAAAAIEWLKGNDENSDFILNLKALVEINDIKPKHFGYAAAITVAYNRAMEKERERADRPETKYFGVVGSRQELGEAELVSIITTEGYYGYSYLHKFVSKEGYVFKWFSSRPTDFEEGQTYNLIGFVKGHEEYKGEKQTAVTRVKVKK
jgi:hypothetical protein